MAQKLKPTRVYTTQKTGKLWKFSQAMSLMGLLTSLAIAVLGIVWSVRGNDDGVVAGFGLTGILAFGLCYFLARFGAWWQHG